MGLRVVCTGLIVISLASFIYQNRLRMQLKQQEIIDRVGKRFNSNLKLNQLLINIIEAVIYELGIEVGAIFLYDPVKEMLDLGAALSHEKGNIVREYPLTGVKFADRVKEHKETLWIKEEGILSVPIKIEDKFIGVFQVINKAYYKKVTKRDCRIIEKIVEQKVGPSLDQARLHEKLRITFIDSIRAVASAIDAKDKYTIGHCQRVAEYALQLGEYMGMGEEQLGDLEYAAILHDVGKIGISDQILNKADSLTDEEYEMMKGHPLLGAEILGKITTLKEDIIWGAKYHHEKYDGTGYCEGLKGEEIPLYARIISIVDAYDAMVGNRVYREGIPVEEALERLEAAKGNQLDPYLTTLFIQMIKEEEEI